MPKRQKNLTRNAGINQTVASMHMQSPPHCFSLGAALREFMATKVGTTALFATELPAANSTKFEA